MLQGLANIIKPGDIVEKLGATLDRFITTKEEKEAIKAEMAKELNRHIEGLEELKVRDMESARNRETNLRNTIGVWVQNISAAVVIVSFVGLMFMMLFHKEDIKNTHLFDVMLGALGVVVTQIFQYWFGSSAGSKSKQDLIDHKISKTN